MLIFSLPGVGQASTPANAGQGLMTTITSISERERNGQHELVIQADGKIPEHSAWQHASPPRIIIDIHHEVSPFKSMVQPISFPEAKSIRVGCHPATIRVVIDLDGLESPVFSSAVQENALVLTLHTDTDLGGESDLTVPEPITEGDPIEPLATPPQSAPLYNAEEHLTRLTGLNVPPAYAKGVTAYRSGDWPLALKDLNGFLETSPADPFAEKAFFLAAKVYDRMHSHDIGSHYTQVKQRYEDAIYRFPESTFVSDAYYAIARLSYRAGMLSQSLGYCNLVVNLNKPDHATLSAKMMKAGLLSSAGKKEDALNIYQAVQRQYPHLPEGVQAKIETAEILFEMNRFRESLDMLKILAQNPDNVSRHPQLSRALGNNYYQLGDFAGAREHLFRYYNTAPDANDGHLVLARIADAYQEEDEAEAAAKFYRLVIQRHPDTEGAMISMYRLAEQQERGAVTEDQNPVAGISVMGKSLGMPREIYEKVVQSALAKNETSPLVQYALLKLSILDIKEKQYGRSLNRLKTLMEQYPRTRLTMEINQAYEKALLHILEADYQVSKYKRIVNTYQAEKEKVAQFTSPELFLIIARAASELKLDGLAGEMFKMADLYLPDREKPADLLFYLAADLMENGKPRAALIYADLLMQNDSEGRYRVDGYMLKGNTLSSLGRHKAAVSLLSAALKNTFDACQRSAILIQKVKTQLAAGSDAEAYHTLLETDETLHACERVDQAVLAEVGELYLESGHPEKALDVFQAVKRAGSQDGSEPRLQLVLARCYEELNNRDSSVSIYSEVAGQDDRFYGKIAREKMEEINFNAVMQKEM